MIWIFRYGSKTVIMISGVGAVGFALGMVIVVIGGVARQLDLTLAPIGTGSQTMAAVAHPG